MIKFQNKNLYINFKKFDLSRLKKTNSFKSQSHGFHIIKPSPWPFLTATALTQLILLCLEWFSYIDNNMWWVGWCFFYFILVISMWFRDVVIESTFQGKHTIIVQRMMRCGFYLVLLSELMFFFGFFLMFLIYVNISIYLNW